eukprot:GEMP01062447.1.p1 GENE.GEMP01062447.1~~GEMP01062447.1.p1  ORF type:complete len:185 (+),score=32.57 GEMP01062447.1:370-924(+)
MLSTAAAATVSPDDSWLFDFSIEMMVEILCICIASSVITPWLMGPSTISTWISDVFPTMMSSKPERKYIASPPMSSTALQRKTLFIRDLPYSVTEKDLFMFIAKVAQPDDWVICRFPDSGRSRGFGFVQMACEEHVQKVIDELDGEVCGGRCVTIKQSGHAISRPNPNRNLAYKILDPFRDTQR